jgi:hypothetical protein
VLTRGVGGSNAFDRRVGETRRVSAAQQPQAADEHPQRPFGATAVLATVEVPADAPALVGLELAVDVRRQATPREAVIEVESRSWHVRLTRRR